MVDGSRAFPHRHLLGIAELGKDDLVAIIDRAEHFYARGTARGQAVAGDQGMKLTTLRGRTVINLFFEASTRTRTSFELAAKRLGADAVNISPTSSSTSKGETLLDTARNLDAMAPDVVVVRHSAGGAPHTLARHLRCAVVNAGDGQHEHPTQALLDAATIRRHKGRGGTAMPGGGTVGGSIEGVEVAIVGDVAHSRVARSNILALTLLGARVRLCGPRTLIPAGITAIGGELSASRTRVTHRLEEALEGADVVMMLRVQVERMEGEAPRFPNARELARTYGLSERTLAWARPDAIVMHPGPVNRGIELAADVADGARAVILEQVAWGVAVRMAVLEMVGAPAAAAVGAASPAGGDAA